MTRAKNDNAGVSAELDAMVGDVLGSFLDALAEGEEPGVVLCLEDAAGARYEAALSEDGIEACLSAAREFVAAHAGGMEAEGIGAVERYAIAYVGCVDFDDGYEDAIIASFYEHGLESGFSAYVLFEGAGTGDGFAWSDPQPAGAEPPLI